MGHATGPLGHHIYDPQVSDVDQFGWDDLSNWDHAAAVAGERRRVMVPAPAGLLDPGSAGVVDSTLLSLVSATDHLDWLLTFADLASVLNLAAIGGHTFPAADGSRRTVADAVRGNLWVGVRVTCQADADALVPGLLRVPAAVRFVLCSPLTGPLDLERLVLKPAEFPERGQPPVSTRALSGWYGGADPDKTRLDWVAVAGGTGPDAKPCHPAWVRGLRASCHAAGVAFRFDGWGEFVPYEHTATPPILESQHDHHVDGHLLPHDLTDRPNRVVAGNWLMDDHHDLYRRVGSKAAGRILDGEVWDEVPAGKTVGREAGPVP